MFSIFIFYYSHLPCCRGKPSGHDVDILITHQDDNRVQGLLVKLVERLDKLVSQNKNIQLTFSSQRNILAPKGEIL